MILLVISLIGFTGRRRYVGIGVALLGIAAASSQTAILTAFAVIGPSRSC